MKLLIAAFLIIIAWYFFLSHIKKNPAVQNIRQAPVRYVNALQEDVRKARKAADTADQKIRQDGEDLKKALQPQ